MPRRIGSKGMGTCSRTPLNIVYSSRGARLYPLPSSEIRLPFPAPVPRSRYGLYTASGPPLGVVGRRAGSSGAVGVGRHYSIWKGLYGPYAALARNLSSGHRCASSGSKDDDP